MKRKILISTVILVVLLSSVALGKGAYINIRAYYDNIKIEVDGNKIELDTEPFIYKDKVFVPVRAIAEGIGCNVEWDSNTKTVITKKYIDIPECDYLNGELFVYGMITDIDYENKRIEIEQHFDDNSIEVTPLLELNEDAVILLQRNNKMMNLEFTDLRCGDDSGLILDKGIKVRGIIITN